MRSNKRSLINALSMSSTSDFRKGYIYGTNYKLVGTPLFSSRSRIFFGVERAGKNNVSMAEDAEKNAMMMNMPRKPKIGERP